MRLPVISGVIRRRILVNYRVAPDAIRRILPSPFEPKLVGGRAIAGICLIRLEEIRPRHLPASLGIASENAAHRIAVTWKGERGEPREGVFIPRRDTGSLWNHLAGNRLFPGEHHRARFEVRDEGGHIQLDLRSFDDATRVHLCAHESNALPESSIFGTLETASDFFRAGSLGYSARTRGTRLDGISLCTNAWRVTPLAVEEVSSSFFESPERFPPGSVEFDCALLMRNIPHEWRSEPTLVAA